MPQKPISRLLIELIPKQIEIETTELSIYTVDKIPRSLSI